MVLVAQECRKLLALAVHAAVLAACCRGALAEPAASPWAEGYNTKARLLTGRSGTTAAPIIAGVEIVMPEGWKTYWRSPGDAGGVPPAFDWSGSGNLASARVLFPAPHRFTDKSGQTIGYKDRVVFPVEISPSDPGKPVSLKLKAEYGVCKDICIPAEAAMELLVPVESEPSPEISTALALVPQKPARPGLDPVLTKWSIEGAGSKPVLRLEVQDPGGAGGDAFVEAPDGLYLPLPKKRPDAGGKALYDVDLSDGVDFKALKGQSLTVTLTGAKGQSETVIKID